MTLPTHHPTGHDKETPMTNHDTTTTGAAASTRPSAPPPPPKEMGAG